MVTGTNESHKPNITSLKALNARVRGCIQLRTQQGAVHYFEQRSVVGFEGSCPVGLKVQVNVRKEACDEGRAVGELEGHADISLG